MVAEERRKFGCCEGLQRITDSCNITAQKVSYGQGMIKAAMVLILGLSAWTLQTVYTTSKETAVVSSQLIEVDKNITSLKKQVRFIENNLVIKK
jgi:hypothetical protein